MFMKGNVDRSIGLNDLYFNCKKRDFLRLLKFTLEQNLSVSL